MVTRNKEEKSIEGVKFQNFGAHIEGDYEGLPYLTVAVAIGTRREELDKFLQIFPKMYRKVLKENNN